MRYIKQIGLLIFVLMFLIGVGYLLSFLPQVWIYAGLFTCVGLLISILIGNIIGMQKIKKIMTKGLRKLKSMYDESNLKGFDTIEDIQRMLNKNHRITNAYLGFVITVLLLLPAFIFALALHIQGIQVVLIILMLVYTDMTTELFESTDSPYGYIVDEKHYPKLHEILSKAKTIMGVNSPVKLYVVVGNNASIAYGNKKHHITLGLHLIQALNERELLSLMLHELAHLVQKDSLNANRWYRSIEWLDKLSQSGIVNIFTQFLYQGMAIYSRFQFELFKQLSSKFIEERADDTLLDKGMNKAYISAGLKIQYYENFLTKPIIYANLTTTEAPSTTHFEDLHQEFLNYLTLNKTTLDQLIPLELVRKRHTHPTLHQRMVHFGVDSFEIEPMGPYDENELSELLKVYNELAPGGKEDYDYTYKYIYEPALKAVNDYKENPSEDKMSLYRYILGLYDIGEVDQYMLTSNRFIELYGGTGYLYYIRGLFFLNHYHDPKGIDEIYKAIEISPKFIDQLEVIGYACVRLGLQDKLDEFKAKMIDMVEHAFEIGLYTTKNRRKLISIEPYTYEEPVMNYLIDVIQGYNLAYSAFLFKETYADGLQQNHLIITANLEDQNRFYLGIQKVKMALSLDNELYQLDTHLSKDYFKKIYKKVQPFYTKE